MTPNTNKKLTLPDNVQRFKRSEEYLKTYAEKILPNPKLREKFRQFMELKRGDPTASFGSSDYSFGAMGPLGKTPNLKHAHITFDISIVYRVVGNVVYLYGFYTHDELGTGTPPKIKTQKSMSDKFQHMQFEGQQQTLTEAATDIVYHYMTTGDAVRTLMDNHYSLESSTGMDAEEHMMPQGRTSKRWYLATTRSKVGDYHVQKATESGAMFVLNGRWLNQHYETRPVDYWSTTWNKIHKLKRGDWKNIDPEYKKSLFSYDPNRSSESEDRVFSTVPEIPLKNSTMAIHVYVIPPHKLASYSDPERRGYRAAEIRKIIQLGAGRDIPVYLYDDKQRWMTQRPQYRIDPNSEYGRQLLSGEPHKPWQRIDRERDYYGDISFWVELITKNPETDTLSAPADKLRYNIKYYPDTVSILKNNMHNAARDPTDPDYKYLVPINSFMTRKKINTLKDLTTYLRQKWVNYNS